MITAVGLFALLLSVTAAVAQEKTKRYSESWPVNSVQTLQINNKYGEVKVAHKGGDNITIDVVVKVDASGRRADELLDMITVSFGRTGSVASAETHFSRNFQSRSKFSIDYEVNIPPDKNLNITNRYGNTFVNILNGNGTFDIQYGNLSVNELNTPQAASINLAYGKSNVETANDLNVTVQYSQMNFGKTGNIRLNSKYSGLSVTTADNVESESRYDNMNFGRLRSFTADARYTQTRIDELTERLKVDAGYGGVRVGRVAPGFRSISVESSYGQISLGLGNESYSIDASCNYCGISFPEGNFKGDRMSENHSRTIRGRVGDGSGGSVYLRSRYGEIKLN